MKNMKLRARARERWLVWREALATAWPLALLVLAGFGVAFYFVKPAPPRYLVMSTGREDGAYHAFAKRYQEIFARNGVTLELAPSGGSGENLRRLRGGEAQVAFVQGGVVPEGKTPEGLLSLGSAFYEPLWVFVRGEKRPERLTELEGKRIAVIQESRSTRALAYRLLAASDVTVTTNEHSVSMGEFAAAEDLQQGNLDALFVIAAPEAPIVQVLLRSPGIRLMNFAQAEAYRRRFPALFRLMMPEGGVDLVYDYPPQDTELLAATANLVAREDLHPALQSLMLSAMREVHGGSGFFQRRGEFPAYKDDDFPLSAAAERFYASGPPFLQRYMPYWLAVLVDRFLILALPLVTLLLPMLRFAPALFSWRIRSRICRAYGELKFLENDIRGQTRHAPMTPEAYASLLTRLEIIENAASRMPIPMRFSDLLYTLKTHINLVREQLERYREAGTPASVDIPDA
ncbi:MAG: ABC transporter substrate-binding protein [Zoogloeaceae bacterium]|nr:ABC transporter substrate-binding protein [Zoogloeaceae bacterium]